MERFIKILNFSIGIMTLIQPSQILIDSQPADNGSGYRGPHQWVGLYNTQRGEFEGKRMISAPDIYQAGKSSSGKILRSLRKDFDKSCEVSSTIIQYSPNDLSALITHNFGSTVVPPTEINIPMIPVYQITPLPQVLNEENGVTYFQSLFNTTDDPKTITEVLKHLSKKKANNIMCSTLDQRIRKNYSGSELDVGFSYIDHMFFVFCNIHFDGNDGGHGRSRGVLINPQSELAKI